MKKLILQPNMLILCVFLLSLAIRIYWITQKEGLHVDEAASISISYYNDYYWYQDFEEDKIYVGKEVKDSSFLDANTLKEAVNDVAKLYMDNRDRPHTNLYYSFLRLSFLGEHTSDLQWIIIRGCGLNLLFFIFSFFFMYKLIRLFFANKWIVAFSLFIAFFNTGAISNTLFIREYQLQETFVILMTYFFVLYYRQIEMKAQLSSWQNLCLIAIITGIALLTGYFVLFYAALWIVVLSFLAYQTKQKENIPFLIVSFAAAFVVAGALYSRYYCGFLTGRGMEALGKLSFNGLIYNFVFSAGKILIIFYKHLFYNFIFLISFIPVIYLIRHKKRDVLNIKKQRILIVILIALLWSAIAMFFAPYKSLRYFVPAFPVITLIIPYIISNIDSRKIKTTLLILYSAIYLTVAFLPDRIDFLYRNMVQEQAFNQTPEIPVIIKNKKRYRCGNIIPYFSDKQYYEFAQSDEKIIEKINKYNKLYLLLEKDDEPLKIPDNYTIEKEFSCGGVYYTGYLLKRANE